MKLEIDPHKVMRRVPAEWLKSYDRGVRGPAGALDDARGVVRVGLIVLAGFFGLLLVWAAFAPLSGAAVASGVVTVDGNRQGLQTLNGGVVEQVLVREGQKVQAGQVLIRMNGLSAGGRYQQTAAQNDALRAAEARLIAERDGLDAIAFPPALAVRAGVPSAAQAMANQTALFDSRKRVFDAERGIQNARLDQSSAEAAGPERQLRFVREQVAGMRSLYRRGFAPKSTLYELERLKVELETQAAVSRARAAEAQLTAVREDEARRGEIVEQLRLVQADLQQVGPQMAMARYNAERDLVRAPVAGAVVGLEQFAPGAVLAPGQKVMDLLPDGRALIVEARINPEDIDDVQVGSRADVRFTTVHPRGPSKVQGVVTTLSADRLTDPATGTAYYLAYIALDPADIRGDDLTLTAGLPASVNIRTHERTALSYIFAPLLDAFSHAGREE